MSIKSDALRVFVFVFVATQVMVGCAGQTPKPTVKPETHTVYIPVGQPCAKRPPEPTIYETSTLDTSKSDILDEATAYAIEREQRAKMELALRASLAGCFPDMPIEAPAP